MGKITSRTDTTIGTGSGNHAKDNFKDGHYYWDRLGKPWETMGKITSRTDYYWDGLGKLWER